MGRRIGLWSLAGFAVACGWVAYTFAAFPLQTRNHLFWAVVEITAPAALLRHVAIKYYWFILLNAVAYAIVGFAIEIVRRYVRETTSSQAR